MPGYFFRYVVPKIGKNLAKKRFHQDDIIKTREKVMTEYGIKDPKTRTALRTKANQPKINKKMADIADRQDKARVKKMGGGMMGRRMGYSQGSNGKPISRSKNPGILAMSKTAKGRKVVKERFKFNPNRIVAKKGGKA
jgi:ribosomal protein L34